MPVVFEDKFDGPAGSLPDPAKWTFAAGPHGNELQTYDANHAKMDGLGHLVITAEKLAAPDPATGKLYASSMIHTLGKFEHQYGLMEVYAQMPLGRGLWPAFWAMGNDHDTAAGNWPRCGEIDITEVLGHDPVTTYGSLHGPKADGSHWAQTGAGHVLQRAWADLTRQANVYGCLWEPGKVTYLLNGVQILQYKATDAFLPAGHVWVFDEPFNRPGEPHPFYLLLNLAVGGSWPGSPDASTVFPAKMLIDWVRFTALPL